MPLMSVVLLLLLLLLVVVVAENGREKREGVEGGGSRLETQVDISFEQTSRHLPTIRKTFTSSVPGARGALLRCSALQ